MAVGAVDSEALALAALHWLEAIAVTDGDGVWWGEAPSSYEPDPTLYQGAAGIVLTLLEAHAHFGDQRWADLAARGTRWLAPALDALYAPGDPSLYGGASGMAFALHAAAGQLGGEGGDLADVARAAALRGLEGVRSGFDGERWDDCFDLLIGNAGVALAALPMGDVELAVMAVEPYLRTAERTAHGQRWEYRRGAVERLHHMSHGTLGIAYALVAVGGAAGRADLVDAALAGVADVVAQNEAGPDGFLVPYSDAGPDDPRRERFSYGWCHGPAGDAQLFRLLAHQTGEPQWSALADRCWHTVTTSGLPAQLRPGFWDNSGHCCGTAGVLALALDRAAEGRDGLAFADVLVADVARRATVDSSGARWSNYEHRVTPPDLEPRTGWAMGSAGLIRELLRHARITTGRDPSYAVQWPDQPAVAVASTREE